MLGRGAIAPVRGVSVLGVHLQHAQLHHVPGMRRFLLVKVSANDHAFVTVDQVLDLAPVLETVHFKLLVPVEEYENDAVDDGFDHARHNSVMPIRILAHYV